MAVSAADGNNGAGIRSDVGNLTVRNCYFHDGQEGILGPSTTNVDTVVIQNSHFARLGVDGYEHDMYIGHAASFTLQNSLIEQGFQGNVVKTRAEKSVIECNQIQNGYDSGYVKNGYLIDMPNGGEEHILNNVLSQGTLNGGQKIMVEFGAEGLNNLSASLEMSGNIMLNDLGAGTFLNLFAAPTAPAQLSANQFVGGGTVVGGAAAASVTESGDSVFATRATAGIAQQFPVPAACQGTIGNLSVP